MSTVPADARAVLVRLAAAAVEAQGDLDDLATAAAERWDDTGIPPWVGAYAGLRAGVQTEIGITPRTRAGMPSRLLMLGRDARPGRITIAIALQASDRTPANAAD
jgi:hypothetical protein